MDRAETRAFISMSNLIALSCLVIGGSLNANEECNFISPLLNMKKKNPLYFII